MEGGNEEGRECVCEGWREGMRKGENVCVMEGGSEEGRESVCERWSEGVRKGERV